MQAQEYKRNAREVIADTIGDLTSPMTGVQELQDMAEGMLTELENEGFAVTSKQSRYAVSTLRKGIEEAMYHLSEGRGPENGLVHDLLKRTLDSALVPGAQG